MLGVQVRVAGRLVVVAAMLRNNASLNRPKSSTFRRYATERSRRACRAIAPPTPGRAGSRALVRFRHRGPSIDPVHRQEVP